jgi:hypothetical protein
MLTPAKYEVIGAPMQSEYIKKDARKRLFAIRANPRRFFAKKVRYFVGRHFG